MKITKILLSIFIVSLVCGVLGFNTQKIIAAGTSLGLRIFSNDTGAKQLQVIATDAVNTVFSVDASGTVDTNSDYYISGSPINVSHWTNDAQYLTYYNTISYADSAGYASTAGSLDYNASGYSPYMSVGYADNSNNAYYANYVNYENDPTFYNVPYDGIPYGYQAGTGWVQVSGDTTFTDWRAGTTYTPSGSTEFNDGASKIVRLWDLPNSRLSYWSDGTNTMEIGKTGSLTYIEGSSDIVSTLDGTHAYSIDAGTSIPFSFKTTKASTDSVEVIGKFQRHTTGTAGNGIGGSQDIYLTNDAGNPVLAGQIQAVMTDVSAGSETVVLKFYALKAGVMTLVNTW
jgi:hypothetical protein